MEAWTCLRQLHSPPPASSCRLRPGVLGPGRATVPKWKPMLLVLHEPGQPLAPIWAGNLSPTLATMVRTWLRTINDTSCPRSRGSRCHKVHFRSAVTEHSEWPHSVLLCTSVQLQDPWLWIPHFQLIGCSKSENRPAATTANSLTQRWKRQNTRSPKGRSVMGQAAHHTSLAHEDIAARDSSPTQ